MRSEELGAQRRSTTRGPFARRRHRRECRCQPAHPHRRVDPPRRRTLPRVPARVPAPRHGDARRVSFLRSRSSNSRFDAHPGRDGSRGASQRARAGSRNSRGGGEEARGGTTGGETSARAARGALRVGTMRRRAARLWRGRLVADVLGSRGGVSDAEVGLFLGRKRRDTRRRWCEALRRRDERGGGVRFRRLLR